MVLQDRGRDLPSRVPAARQESGVLPRSPWLLPSSGCGLMAMTSDFQSEGAGSIPVIRSREKVEILLDAGKFSITNIGIWRSVVSASGWGPEGRVFESPYPDVNKSMRPTAWGNPLRRANSFWGGLAAFAIITAFNMYKLKHPFAPDDWWLTPAIVLFIIGHS